MNNYKKLKVLGKGAFGEVYKIKSLIDGKEYALKSVKINHTGSLNELDLLRRLEHPNLLHAVDFWVDKNTETLQLVLPLADSTLFDFLNKHKNIDMDFKIKWMYELVSVVHFLHKSGYSHCDLKPENIFLVNNKIMLADFSLAYPLGTDMFACGTYVYTSPQANEKYLHNVVSHFPEGAENMEVILTDIYMLGIIFICIFGNVDFPRMQTNMSHQQFIMGIYYMTSIESEINNFLTGMRVPLEWQPLIKKMIALSQTDRYQTTDSVLLYEEFKNKQYHEPIRGKIIVDGCSTPYICGKGQITEDIVKEIFENMLLYASDNSIKIFVDSIYIFYRVLGHLKFTDKQVAKGYGYACLYIASLCNLGNVALDSFFNFTAEDLFDKVIEIITLLDGRLMCSTIFDLALSKDELIEGLKLVTNCSWKKTAEAYHYEYIANEDDIKRIYRESKYILCNDILADEIL